MRQTSRPDRTRRLANRDLDLGHVDLLAQPSDDLIDRCTLKNLDTRQRPINTPRTPTRHGLIHPDPTRPDMKCI